MKTALPSKPWGGNHLIDTEDLSKLEVCVAAAYVTGPISHNGKMSEIAIGKHTSSKLWHLRDWLSPESGWKVPRAVPVWLSNPITRNPTKWNIDS